ncbi:ABC transporter substrate-binding protein [Gemella cuniculi]|uniref:ABC transporter substrate-binding protein n=1 Tax=Gemella cuniculi TaxID=150240 RepID=UPI00040E3364|nr:ABC transporter substrate-binding protein [Gemella cuniculi]
MKKKNILKVFSSAMALSVILAGCSTNSKTSKETSKPAVDFKTSVDNGGEVVKDATLKVGILSGDPLTGMFNPVFYLQATDSAVMEDTMSYTFASDHSYKLKEDDEDAPVKFHLDRDKNQSVLTIRNDLKWNDGKDVTADDIIATYELMGNPKYTDNIRYKVDFEVIEGMKDYHEGKATKISGISKKDDKTVVIQYKEIKAALLWGSGFITTFLNKDQVDAASKDFSKFVEAELNTKPLSYGPYYLDKVVNGESVLAKQNPYFYKKDDVKIKEIQFKVVTPAQASSVLKNGDVDYMASVTPNVWNATKDANNGTLLGQPDFYISYVGFKLGTWDKENGEVKVNPEAKAADKRVRQAFGYAVDWDQINEKIYKGLRFTPTNSGIYPPRSEDYYNKDGQKFKKDVEKAKQLLDEAGLKDTDGDGLREDKNGNKLTFNFAIRNTGQDYDQTLADSFIKSWKEVGLDVRLTDGKLMSAKDWTQRVTSDDPSIDLFQGAWGLGTNPNPSRLLGDKARMNYQRYISDTLKKDLETIDSKDMLDDAKRKEAYQKFDKDFAEEAAWLPFSWNTEITWVNKRIKNFDVQKYSFGEQKMYTLELTSNDSIKG